MLIAIIIFISKKFEVKSEALLCCQYFLLSATFAAFAGGRGETRYHSTTKISTMLMISTRFLRDITQMILDFEKEYSRTHEITH